MTDRVARLPRFLPCARAARRLGTALVAVAAVSLPGIAAAQQARPQPRPATPQGIVPDGQEKTFPFDASWLLVDMAGKRVPFGAGAPNLSLDKQLRARGFAGCNTFSLTMYPVRRQALAVGPVALTRKACDRAVMEEERRFLILLRTANVWDLEAGQLVLKGPGGALRFQRSI